MVDRNGKKSDPPPVDNVDRTQPHGVPATGSWTEGTRTHAISPSSVTRAASDLAHYLVVREGLNPGSRAEIGAEPVLVGRSKASDFRLSDGAVSSRHCTVSVSGTALLVSDLGSTNGTYVNGVRIDEPTLMAPDSVLQVGSQVLIYEHRSRSEVQRTREMTAELERARTYVEALFPPPMTEGAVRSDWSFVPCDVLGGDALGYHFLDDGRLAVYLIDVCGHGTAAALHSLLVINTLKNRGLVGADFGDPVSVLGGMNEIFQMNEHGDLFFTVWYGVYTPARRELVFAAAGHPPALVAAPGGGPPVALGTRGLPVGVSPDAVYTSGAFAIAPGHALYVYSDGVYEFKKPDGVRWGHQAFVDEVARREGGAAREVARLRDVVREQAETEVLADDFCLMVLEFD